MEKKIAEKGAGYRKFLDENENEALTSKRGERIITVKKVGENYVAEVNSGDDTYTKILNSDLEIGYALSFCERDLKQPGMEPGD